MSPAQSGPYRRTELKTGALAGSAVGTIALASQSTIGSTPGLPHAPQNYRHRLRKAAVPEQMRYFAMLEVLPILGPPETEETEMNSRRSLTRPATLLVASALAAASISTGGGMAGPGIAGAQTGSLGSATPIPSPPAPPALPELFVISPITVTPGENSTTFSGTVENTTSSWSNCAVDVVDAATVARFEDLYTSNSYGTLDDFHKLYYDEGRILGNEIVTPDAGQTAAWSLTSVGLEKGFTPGLVVWCWAGADEGTDYFYFVDDVAPVNSP